MATSTSANSPTFPDTERKSFPFPNAIASTLIELKGKFAPGDTVSNQSSKTSTPFVNSGFSMNPKELKLASKKVPTAMPKFETSLTVP